MSSPYDSSVGEPDPRSSLVRVRMGNRTYDAQYVRSCHTCTHPVRALIEEKVLLNYSFPAIAEMYSGREVASEGGGTIRLPDISWRSIQNHYQGRHMPLELEVKRRIVEARAEAMGEQLDGAADRIVEAREVVQMVLEQGHDQLARRQMEVDTKDTLAAAKLLTDLDERAGAQNADAEAWSQAMGVYFETAREVMTPDQWRQFTRRLSANPVLRALEAAQDDDVVDAEFTTIERL